ncbi:uncharacterized protein LOC125820932 [Solanum verrucosum]|uniref:uncharacterized protein LOC125820932 n=1 Tax=Solanum verrucosum TaxID=315347 RepID=UPI0020CFEDED|nr:uncharacterized protein LOC125820932 [Solanum verrucosum]
MQKDKQHIPSRGHNNSDSSMESPKEISNSESTHIGSAIREKHREEKYTDNAEMKFNMENKEDNTIVQEEEHHKVRGTPNGKTPRIDKMQLIEVNKKQDEEEEDDMENELKFTGSCYTWWNGRIEEDCIFKRLDRVFGNNEFMNTFQGSEVHHLIKEGFEHASLHVRCNNVQEQIRKPFRFLNFWVKHKDFVKVVATLEDVIKAKEAQLKINLTTENRIGLKKAEADLKRYIHIEEEYWKQKRDLISSTENIGEEAINVFREQFTETNEPTDYTMLENIPNIISNEHNEEIERLPTEDEVKNVIFALNGDSASGPDGYSGQFFQSCWEIVKQDIINMVKAFYCGMEMPRFITHTNLILIPKMETMNNFGDLRPISLSIFTNKIITRMLHERLVPVLPVIISRNQSGFIKGRSITENVLLAQEIVRDINGRNKFHNVVVKLDMAKTYDRVSWKYLVKGLRKFGFSERIIDMVVRVISNNWYSVNEWGEFWFLGDHLSPTLFIIAAARSLNKLFKDPEFKGTSTSSLWTTYMWNKYCKKHHPIIAQGFGASHVWRKMVLIREEVEHEIWWQIKTGSSSFWFDKWTKLRSLYYLEEEAMEEEIEVKEFITERGWNRQLLWVKLSIEMTDHIMDNIKMTNTQYGNDVSWWMGNTHGRFTVKSAWNLMRNKHEMRKEYELIWKKELPFKFSFFMWRVWKRRIVTDDNLKKMKINIISRCWCCQNKKEETMTRLFLTGLIANKL